MKADISFRETYCITNNKKCERTELKKAAREKLNRMHFPVIPEQ